MFLHKRLRNKNYEEQEKKFRDELKKVELEKNDIPAMIIAAFIVVLPALLLALGVIFLFIWLFFLRY